MRGRNKAQQLVLSQPTESPQCLVSGLDKRAEEKHANLLIYRVGEEVEGIVGWVHLTPEQTSEHEIVKEKLYAVMLSILGDRCVVLDGNHLREDLWSLHRSRVNCSLRVGR